MSHRPLRAACIAAVAAVLVTVGPIPAADAEPGASGESVGALLTRLQGLYQKAEEATEAYNATEVALKTRQDEERRLTAELGKARTALGSEKALLGRLAREQYQGTGGGISPYARMLLAGNPQAALDQRRLAAREGARQAAVLERLARGEREAGTSPAGPARPWTPSRHWPHGRRSTRTRSRRGSRRSSGRSPP